MVTKAYTAKDLSLSENSQLDRAASSVEIYQKQSETAVKACLIARSLHLYSARVALERFHGLSWKTPFFCHIRP